MMMVVLKMKSRRIMRWESESEEKFEFAKKSESEKLFRRLEVATETLAAHMRLMIMMPWWLSSWYLYWLGNSCDNGNIIPLIVRKMMQLIIVLENITTMRVKIMTTMWIILIIVLLGWWYWWWWYWWRRRFDPGGWKLWRRDLRPSPMPEEASMLNPRCFFKSPTAHIQFHPMVCLRREAERACRWL